MGFAPAALGIRGLGAQQVETSALELVEGSGRGDGEQSARHVERARLQGSPRRRPALGPPGVRVAGQRHRALEERGRGGEAAARLRPAG